MSADIDTLAALRAALKAAIDLAELSPKAWNDNVHPKLLDDVRAEAVRLGAILSAGRTFREAVREIAGSMIVEIDLVPEQAEVDFPASLSIKCGDGQTIVTQIDTGIRIYNKDGSFIGLWKCNT